MTNQNKQQTAVEWFYDEMIKFIKLRSKYSTDREIFKQAKEMEKVKQKYFFDCGRQYQLTGEGTFNQVYNETYGGNK
jgi:hypothetical protein